MADFDVETWVPDIEAIFAEVWAEAVPEVLPVGAEHDDWGGAAGCEIRDEPYMPYPHDWDWSLHWCQIRLWMNSDCKGPIPTTDDIPGELFRRAIQHINEET